jgi:adenosylhomocysteine nucleosidase
MWTSDELITDPAVLARLREQGVVALDMETAAVAEVCVTRGIPWSVFRVISDRATDGSVNDEVFHLSHQDGTPDGTAVAAYLLKHPGKVPDMARMARAARRATELAAAAAVEAVGQLRTP